MTTALDCSLTTLLDLYADSEERIALARQRQKAATGQGVADYLPLVFGAPVPGMHVEANLLDVFHSDEDMLRRQFANAISIARSGADGVPCIRAEMGTGFLPTLAGLRQEHFTDKMPWLVEHHTPEKIAEWDVAHADLSQRGEMPRCLRFLKYARQRLPSTVDIFLPDTQGPCDLVHLLLGEAFFYLAHDDPELMQVVFQKATDLYIRGTTLLKQALAQPMNVCPHSHSYYFEDIGVRICEDSSTLIGPNLVDEYVIPYMRKAAAACGNAWAHYCGDNKQLYKRIVEDAPEIKGLNFGNPERYDPHRVLPHLLEHNKFYVGNWPRKKDESLVAYFSRILAPVKNAKRGLVFSPDLTPDELEDPASIMALWHRLQD